MDSWAKVSVSSVVQARIITKQLGNSNETDWVNDEHDLVMLGAACECIVFVYYNWTMLSVMVNEVN